MQFNICKQYYQEMYNTINNHNFSVFKYNIFKKMLFLDHTNYSPGTNYLMIAIGVVYHYIGLFINIPSLANIAQVLSIVILIMTGINFGLIWYHKYVKKDETEDIDKKEKTLNKKKTK